MLSFLFCDARKTFHRQAAREAWGLTLSFLIDNLKPAS
jgi:hypothetical protein